MLKDQAFVQVTIPSCASFEGADDSSPYLGPTVCLVSRNISQVIISSQRNPAVLRNPLYETFQVAASHHGFGLFAMRDLSFGELILVERPFTITPTSLPVPGIIERVPSLAIDEQQSIVTQEWEKNYLSPLVANLSKKAQIQFMALENIYNEYPSVLGVIRTNGLDVGSIEQNQSVSGELEYAAVCKTISRLNHSCCPNAERSFDLSSFTFQVRAVRDLAKGEEITITYCNLLQTARTRQKELSYWKFTCACSGCASATIISDNRRFQIWKSMKELKGSSPDSAEERIKNSSYWISLIVTEGLEASDAYKEHLEALVNAYSDRTDIVNREKYRVLLKKCSLAQTGEVPVILRKEYNYNIT